MKKALFYIWAYWKLRKDYRIVKIKGWRTAIVEKKVILTHDSNGVILKQYNIGDVIYVSRQTVTPLIFNKW